jgi:hypothetical protein
VLFRSETEVTSLPDDIQAKQIYINKFKLKNIPNNIKPTISKEIDVYDLILYLNDNPSEIKKYKSILEENRIALFVAIRDNKAYNLLKNENIISLMFTPSEYIPLEAEDHFFSEDEKTVKELASTGIYNNPLFLKYFNDRYFIEKTMYIVITHPNLYMYYKDILLNSKNLGEEIGRTKFEWKKEIFNGENISKKSILALLQKLNN